MDFKKYNVVVARHYANDPEKKAWKNVGSLLVFAPTADKPEPGYILELNMYPTTDFKIFAATEKKAEAAPAPAATQDSTVVPDDIPF